MTKRDYALIILIGLVLAGAGYLWYRLANTEARAAREYSNLTETIIEKDLAIASSTARIGELETLLQNTETLLTEARNENEDLARDLRREKDKNEEFEEQIEEIGSTVGSLDKLAKLDKELLMKYSKVYFLNEHYMPDKLTEIDKRFLGNPAVPKFIQGNVRPFLEDMIADAADDGITLKIVSAFRSFDEQEDLKGAYAVTYGSGANTFSADQGYSEHQLGTTVDLTTDTLGGGLTGFQNTPAYAWLLDNAHKYGFVLSYPENNAYYIFEPWHWRFVGEDLARDLHADEKHFYDLDQREIDSYLISIFD